MYRLVCTKHNTDLIVSEDAQYEGLLALIVRDDTELQQTGFRTWYPLYEFDLSHAWCPDNKVLKEVLGELEATTERPEDIDTDCSEWYCVVNADDMIPLNDFGENMHDDWRAQIEEAERRHDKSGTYWTNERADAYQTRKICNHCHEDIYLVQPRDTCPPPHGTYNKGQE